jgi:transcriptional regulator with XRE-family HTH domain
MAYYFADMSAQRRRTTFGANLRRLRLERGLTQTQLGHRVGLSKRMVAHYELHATRPPAEKVSAIAQALSIKIDDLMDGNGTAKLPNVDPKFARKLERAKALPCTDQMLLGTMIDSMVKKNKGT